MSWEFKSVNIDEFLNYSSSVLRAPDFSEKSVKDILYSLLIESETIEITEIEFEPKEIY